MATNKNRNTVRARNVPLGYSVESVKDVICHRFEASEKTSITCKITLAPTCTDNGETQTAIIKFSPSMPSFLSRLSEKREQIEMKDSRDIDIDQDFYGLTQLYPTHGSRIPLDIIAVTGLNGHAFGSWTGGKDRMWLRDFLCEDEYLKACRTMIFGYNAKLKDQAVHMTRDYVRSFLEELRKARKTREERNRPIVFLGHSFGGILIAHALVKAREKDDGSLVKATHAFLFFGVPHRGISLSDVTKMVKDLDYPLQREKLVNEIIESSSGINPIMESFINMTMGKKIISFYETRMTRAVAKNEDGSYGRSGEYIEVVKEPSARLYLPHQIEEAIPVEGDHSTMVKFASSADNTYQSVRNYLRDYLESFGFTSGCHHAVAEGLVAHFAHTPEPLDQALRLAADLGLVVEALYLLRKGAHPNFWDTEPRPLGALSSHSATISGPRWKIKSNGDIMGPGETAIFRAAVRNHKHVVELLLQWQADPNLAAESGKTPLHEAASRGHLALVQLLLEHRADPNARDSIWESTPLHDAARAGTTAVALLHRYHADLNAQLKFSRDTPLHLAVREGHEEVVYFLLEKNANPVPTNKSGRRPVHDAARAGNISLVGWLLERDRKGETDPRDNRGWTPMHEAAYGGHNNVVWLLLRRGADGNAALRDGRRAVDLAKERGHGETRKLILASTAGE
ncbi:hypothetical protein Z517_01669 [Fonsecaea pedrosoi CBS 271.37]|uniref:DUF676 domain-containing protein n=1 Tax=Fonsecaea pedrosoi CBS 271.37 TaxID=1442368 RepID=A0A0D2HP89_9EURO|nr:uncharacterized protein Z517_01669 [Fonsecaea pedrosoi CBS 271.37]KIW86274.1 hypothetical protein Z517_01669 [Fonsecaea pedrosoi CBS 271.37]